MIYLKLYLITGAAITLWRLWRVNREALLEGLDEYGRSEAIIGFGLGIIWSILFWPTLTIRLFFNWLSMRLD